MFSDTFHICALPRLLCIADTASSRFRPIAMALLLLTFVMMATTPSVFADEYLWKISCNGSVHGTRYCLIPGMHRREMNYFTIDLLEKYPTEFNEPCTEAFYKMEERDNYPYVRVSWRCRGLFGIKRKVKGFPYKGKCGQNNYGYRIISGRDARQCQFPWMAYVKLNWKPGYSSSCGGSIIHEKWILTAGHCVIKQGGDGLTPPTDGMYVRTGSLYKWEDYYERTLDRLITYPEFNFTYLFHDIALMELTKPIKWDGCTSPVCLNREMDVDKAKDLTCIISGWGKLRSDPLNREYPKNLRWAYDRILSRKTCDGIYPSISSDYNFCGRATSDNNRGFCAADSGGPLVCKNEQNGRFYQHGVVSLYLAHKTCRMEGLYRKVAAYYDWIKTYVPLSDYEYE